MMMILGVSMITLVDDTFVGTPLSVIRVRGPVTLAVTLFGQETPRHPAPGSIFPTTPNRDLRPGASSKFSQMALACA